MNELIEKILSIQGDGNYMKAKNWTDNDSVIPEELQHDLDRLKEANIPIDIVFEQGPATIGL